MLELSNGGADAWFVKAVADGIRRTGLRRFIFKSDQGPAIVDLKRRVDVELVESREVIVENSRVNERESSGVIERAVQTVGGMIRIHKLALEQAGGEELEVGLAAARWLTVRAGVTVSLFEVGSDGRAACERARGKNEQVGCEAAQRRLPRAEAGLQ